MFSYDPNGNLTSDGINPHTWDRANRLRSLGSTTYAYNGDGNRVQQNAVKYLLDMQPGLAYVIGDSADNRYVHGPRGIHAAETGTGWTWPVQDALGSVRGYVGDHNRVLSNVNYSEYGVSSAPITGFAFTGEWRDQTGVQYHRARYLSPALGGWLSLDPWEGMVERIMSMNGYAWVEGNPISYADHTGAFIEPPYSPCSRVLRPTFTDDVDTVQRYIDCLTELRRPEMYCPPPYRPLRPGEMPRMSVPSCVDTRTDIHRSAYSVLREVYQVERITPWPQGTSLTDLFIAAGLIVVGVGAGIALATVGIPATTGGVIATLMGFGFGAGAGLELVDQGIALGGDNQFDLDCIDWGELIEATLEGGLYTGAVSVLGAGGPVTVGALVGGGGYIGGVVATNVINDRAVFTGINLRSLAINMLGGGVTFGVNSAFRSFLQSWFGTGVGAVDALRITEISGYPLIGFLTYGLQFLVDGATDGNPGIVPEIPGDGSIGPVLSLSNVFSVFQGMTGNVLALFLASLSSAATSGEAQP
jgi:RHS repeat-associated protein